MMNQEEALKFIANLIPDFPNNTIKPEDWCESKDQYKAMLGAAICAAREALKNENKN